MRKEASRKSSAIQFIIICGRRQILILTDPQGEERYLSTLQKFVMIIQKAIWLTFFTQVDLNDYVTNDWYCVIGL